MVTPRSHEISVTPWSDDAEVKGEPASASIPKLAEWSEPNFWSKAQFFQRLTMIQIFFAAEIATFDHDCTGSSRNVSDAPRDVRFVLWILELGVALWFCAARYVSPTGTSQYSRGRRQRVSRSNPLSWLPA